MDSKHLPRNFGLGAFLFLSGAVGCEHPAHRERVVLRERNLGETAAMLVEMEADRSEKMERTLAMLRNWHRDELAKSRRAAAEAGEWLHDDLTRWQRNETYNRELLEDLGRGNLRNIEETIPVILY